MYGNPVHRRAKCAPHRPQADGTDIGLDVSDLWLLARGGIYSAAILTGEFISGSLLKKHDCCPWDYSHAKFNIRGIIRLDYAPLWMGAGLLFEQILGCHQERTRY